MSTLLLSLENKKSFEQLTVFFNAIKFYLCLSPGRGESSPIITCGVFTVADLEDFLLGCPLPGRLDLLPIVGPMTNIVKISMKMLYLILISDQDVADIIHLFLHLHDSSHNIWDLT